ncbi:MAG: glycosyltransferase family 2 protein [Actinomycetota bacterium]|nr:glycosyltransferase family 2 protein [Actinomycetota bacterium]
MKASVVVLTYNAGPAFEGLLESLIAQETDFDYEVLVVDSGSTDGTAELARRYGVGVHRIPQTAFDHGMTRNTGISLSRGEYVALIVQDAVPLDRWWLAAMVENLDRDGLVAGVYGRQIPRPESGALTRALVSGWPTAAHERREQFVGTPGLYREMPPRERRLLATFDNVSSCLRRSVWEQIPFEQTSFGEDLRWGARVIEAGYKLVYEPRSAVLHSHERGGLYDLRRNYVDQLVLLDLFELELVPSSWRLVLNILRSTGYLYLRLRRDQEMEGGAARRALLAFRYALLSQVGAYLGVKNLRLAGVSPRASARLDDFMSGGI